MMVAYLKHKLSTDAAWALKGLVRIYDLQTLDEKQSNTTCHLNDIGFSGADAEILSSFASQFLKWNRLSDKQMAIVFKKMPRYHGQIVKIIKPENMANVERDAIDFHKQNIPAVNLEVEEMDTELD